MDSTPEQISTNARSAAEEIDALLVPLREYAQTPGIGTIAAVISRHFTTPAPVAPSSEARALVEQWATDHDDDFIVGDAHIDLLAEAITAHAHQRYVEGLRDAVQAAERAFKAAHTYASENADDYHRFDDGQRYAINNIVTAIRVLLEQTNVAE